MASVISTVLQTVVNIIMTLEIDEAELATGGLVKVGQVGTVQSKPVYVYLSENASAT